MIQKHFEETGEIPGGCKVRLGGERYWIEDVKLEEYMKPKQIEGGVQA